MAPITLKTLADEGRRIDPERDWASWQGFVQRCIAYVREHHPNHRTDFKHAADVTPTMAGHYAEAKARVLEYLRTLDDLRG